MPCNAYNHPSDCNCGWGGKWHGNFNSAGGRAASGALDEFISPEVEWAFLSPNARCPVCEDPVYFYANSYGSRVFFDDVGPPWPKHECTDRVKFTHEFFLALRLEAIRSRHDVRPPPTGLDRNGWQAFRVLRTRSFRLEVEHLRTKRRFETNVLKDTLPPLSEAIWMKVNGDGLVEISYFDPDKFRVSLHALQKFDARKFATMGEWIPFKLWFRTGLVKGI